MKVGFIGLGSMGRGMALNLLKAEIDLVVFDTNDAAVRAMVEAGAASAASVGELARQVDVVFTSLPGPVQIEEVVLGPDGIVQNMRSGLALFDLSTSSLALARRMCEAFEKKGGAMLDAPISGGPAGAASGQLAIWVGGDKEVYDRHLKLLQLIGNGVRHLGPIGAGIVTKLVHNMACGSVLLAMSEAFSVASKAGVDPLTLWEALSQGSLGRQTAPTMLVNQFLPGKFEPAAFALRLAHKDMTLATGLGKELGVPLRLANLTLEEMTEALGRGMGEQDMRAFLKLQLERAGVQIAVEPERLQAAVQASRS